MNKIVYIAKRICSMDRAGMRRACKDIAKRNGKGLGYRAKIFADMVACGFKYGAGYTDYRVLRFYELNAAQRATYLNRTKSNQLVDRLNNPADRHILANKADFNRFAGDVIGRDWLDVQECSLAEFLEFCVKHPVFIAKPNAANSGEGVRKIDYNKELAENFADGFDLHRHLVEEGVGIIEEVIPQCEELSEIHPGSVNTVRVYTLIDEAGKTHILCTLLRAGVGGNVVDNANAGGIVIPVNAINGELRPVAYDKHDGEYTTHPTTGVRFEGRKIPFWNDIIALCIETAQKLPSLRYVGWDVAVTPTGPVLVEGNHIPDHCLLQLEALTSKDRTGMLPVIERILSADMTAGAKEVCKV